MLEVPPIRSDNYCMMNEMYPDGPITNGDKKLMEMMDKVSEQELVDRVADVLMNIEKDEFLVEVNRILGAEYTEDSVEWSD